jgi:hypothetical protein
MAHPGAFCSPVGGEGESKTGTPMICNVSSDKPGDRARWRRNGPSPARPSRARGTKKSSSTASAGAATLPQVDTGITPPPADLDAQIRDAYRNLAARPGQTVALADLRDQFPDVPKAQLDQALNKMLDAPGVRLEPEPFGHRIGDRERGAAINVGDEDRHSIAIGEDADAWPDARPAAAPVPPPASSVTPTPAPAPVSAPAEKPAAKVDGRHTTRAPKPNQWGSIPEPGNHCTHYDGPITRSIEAMGPDAQIDMGGGEPLADTLGDIADEVRSRRIHPADLPAKLREVQNRLPEGSTAHRKVGAMAALADAPATPVPALPATTPQPLRDLVSTLHRIPVCRQDPDRELDKLVALAKRHDAGELRGRDLERELGYISRHEMWSDTGSYQINEAIQKAKAALHEERRARMRQQP